MGHTHLTKKQEAFCQGIADGLNGADAYRAAYDAEAMSENGVYREASILLRNPKVSSRIADLKSKTEAKALWTREMSVKALLTAYRDGPASTKVAAVRELNLMHGFNSPTKHEVETSIKIVRSYGMEESE